MVSITQAGTARESIDIFVLAEKLTIEESHNECRHIMGGPKISGGYGMVRILLADEHGVVRSGLRSFLEARTDFSICAEASNGREAIDLAMRKRPDVAILDISLSVINGVEATRQIRRGVPETEILIFTARADEDLVREALSAGARGYLLKSETDDQIIKAIESLARHNAYFSGSISDCLLDNLIPHSEPGNGCRLTAREREVVRLVAEGNSSKTIAIILGISTKTVDTHRTAAMRKINVRSVADVVRYAVRTNLIEP
jgi:DNA-binding NarL/FixJ family response regulator